MSTALSTGSAARSWQAASVLAYLVMIATNALANMLPLFGRTTGEVSDRFPTLFTPAAYTFAVWGLIYLLLAAFVIYQALPRARHDERLSAARPLFVLSSALNALWLISWHALALPLSELLMLALLVTLIVLYVRAGAWQAPASAWQRWLVDVPIAIYLGWISVATIANTAILLVSRGVDGGGAAPLLTTVMLAAATVLGLLALVTRRDWAYALAVGWGIAGIAVARTGEAGGVSTAAVVAVVVLAVAVVVAVVARSGAAPEARAAG